jgi:hypothetical protein
LETCGGGVLKYSTVEIRPKSFGEEGFRVSDYEIPHEREATAGSLNPGIGFFHYPRKIGSVAAMKQLKEAMIAIRQKEVDLLLRDIELLRELS